MEMRKVTSSNVEAVGYADGTLAIKFANGGTYHYDNVPQATYDKLMDYESTGKGVAALIRPHYKGKLQEEKKPGA